MKKILFLSTHSLSTNPRLVKEIRLALRAGYKVTVICFTFNNWSKTLNDALLEELSTVHWILLPAGRQPVLPWLVSVIAEKGCRLLVKAGIKNKSSLGTAVSRRNHLLLRALNKVGPPDWVIGHNPGALYACLKAAQLFKCKAGFDVEDYHPGEGHNIFLQELSRKLMQEVLPAMDYVSYAAPLIREAVKEDWGKEGINWLTVLNYFPAAEFVAPKNVKGPLKLVWFSQNISVNRGLEYMLPVLKSFLGEIELHLFGKMDVVFYETHLRGLENIIIHKPIQQKKLHHELSNYDVGLALEPKKDLNNDLAISNKILAYLQAGLFVLATTTSAQKQLIESLPEHGFISETKTTALENALNNLLMQKENIRSEAIRRFDKVKTLCWEEEAKKIAEQWI